tara:strand:- start:28923 stop:29369 length:447 start_codon:yes stop_codon:yes gene_type:complete
MRRQILAAILVLAPAASAQYGWRDALDAIRQVETGGRPNQGRGARGDSGNALGPYQIWRAYHADAAERNRSLSNYAQCLTDLDYSEQVIRTYMRRYCRSQAARLDAGTATLGDCERIARCHNGGPKGYRKKATLGYWHKVQQHLRSKP